MNSRLCKISVASVTEQNGSLNPISDLFSFEFVVAVSARLGPIPLGLISAVTRHLSCLGTLLLLTLNGAEQSYECEKGVYYPLAESL